MRRLHGEGFTLLQHTWRGRNAQDEIDLDALRIQQSLRTAALIGLVLQHATSADRFSVLVVRGSSQAGRRGALILGEEKS